MARKRTPSRKKPSPRSKARAAAVAAGAVADNQYVVYVHGICRHEAGYSNPWWAALTPFLDGAIPDDHHLEVLWSDIITPAAPAAAALPPAPRAAQAAVTRQIQDVLTDRALRQLSE